MLTKSSLNIRNIQDIDDGVYVCKVDNANVEMTVNINVTGKLNVKIFPTRQSVKINDRVQFTCEITGGPVDAVKWLHNGMIIRNANDKTLTIESVQLANKGFYQCMVGNKKEMVQTVAELDLSNIAPQLVEVFKESTVRPKDSISLKCKANGSPSPTIEWTVDRKKILRGQRTKISFVPENGGISSDLSIDDLVVEDGGLYSCVASNKGGKTEHSARVNVYGKVGIRSAPPLIAVSNDRFYLNCPFYGFPYEEIQWRKDNSDLPNELRQRFFDNGTLIFNDVDKSVDAGQYKCLVRSQSSEILEGHIDVRVLVPPKVIPFSFLDDQFYKGMRAHVSCAISQGDLPVTFEWLKDGDLISSDMGIFTRKYDENTESLSIENVESRHSGNYSCIIRNVAGKAMHTAQLMVRGKSHILEYYINVSFFSRPVFFWVIYFSSS